MSRLRSREVWVPLALFAAWLLDRVFPMTSGDVHGAWLVPAIMGASALLSAIKGRRQEKNNAEAQRYAATRQNEVDRYTDALAKAKRGERVRYANALASSRGFALPALDTSASENEQLRLPEVPKFKSGGFLELVGDALGGVGQGISAEANLNAARGSLPAGDSGPTGSVFGGGDVSNPFASQGGDAYTRFLSRTPYFSFKG